MNSSRLIRFFMFIFCCSFLTIKYFLKSSCLFSFIFGLTSFPSLFSLLCFDSRTLFFFGVKREILLQTWENANKEIWKNLSFCFAHLSPKKKLMFFKKKKKQKWKIHFLKRPEKSKNECLKQQFLRFFLKPRGNSENNFGNVRKGFFWWEKSFFSKEQDWKMQQRKKSKPKREEKLKGFHRKRWKEEMIKETEKKHEGLATTKGEKSFFFFFEKCLVTKKGEQQWGGWTKREGTSGGYIQRSGNMKRVNR